MSVTGIGELREGPLHAAVKDLLAVPGDRARCGSRGSSSTSCAPTASWSRSRTGGFSPLGRKLDALLDGNRMRIVFPVPAERRIIRINDHGEVLSSRKSPLKGSALDVFDRSCRSRR